MVLTEEQKKEILRKYINPETDFVEANNGQILMTIEASQRIAGIFKLKIDGNAQFEPMAIANYIIRREKLSLAAAASIARAKEEASQVEEAIVDRVVNCVKELVEQGKNDFEIAQALQEQCSDLLLSDINKGIIKATQDGILPQSNVVQNNLNLLINRASITKKFICMSNNTKDRKKLATDLSNYLFNYYMKDVFSLGHLRIALMDAGIEEDVIKIAVDGFYQLYELVFLEKFGKTNLSLEGLADKVYDKYLYPDVFDSRVIIGYIEKLNNENVNLEELTYYLYRKEGDERLVSQVMLIQGISVDERVQKLKDLGLQYPATCLKRTFEMLKPAYVLPYDEILQKYMATENEKVEDPLTAVEEPIAVLNATGDDFECEEVGCQEAIPPEDNPLRLKIIAKENEVKAFEKKRTLATLLIGAGFIPVAVLSLVFKVEPLVASKNCVTALKQLINGSMGLKDFLPSADQLTTLLAGMGTTFVGFVKFLKNEGKMNQDNASSQLTKGRCYC